MPNARLQVESTEARTIAPTQVLANLESTVRDVPPDGYPAIPGYDILQQIGRGGMSRIFLARQRRPNRLAAIKMILREHSLHEHMRRRFLREAYSIASLRHPNVVKIYEIAEISGILYLCLEYVAGGSLETLIRERRPTPKLAADIMRQLATAVQAAHDRNIIHRDLKPANVLCAIPDQPDNLTETGGVPKLIVKVTDFGLARMISEASEETRSGAPIGTPSYMSPEQASGRLDDIGVPSDIYGLGAILYELLTGQPPFRCETMTETVNMVLRDTPVPPHRLAPGAPPDLERICLQCLEKDPFLRYPTATDLAEDLDRYLAGRAVVARPRTALSRWLRSWRCRPLRLMAYVGAASFVVAGSLSLAGWLIGDSPTGRGLPADDPARLESQTEPPALSETDRLLQRVRQNPTLPETVRKLAELGDEKLAAIVRQHARDFSVLLAVGDAYLLHLNLPDAALPLYKDARRLAEEQIPGTDGGVEGSNNLAWALERLGDVQLLKKERASALRDYDQARSTRDTLVQNGPSRQRSLDLARICGKQAELLMEELDNRTALLLYVQRLDQLVGQRPQAPELAPEIRHAHQRLARINRLLGNAEVAAFHDKAAATFESKTP